LGAWGSFLFIEFQKSSDHRRQARALSLIHVLISHSVEVGSKTQLKDAWSLQQLSVCDPPGTEPTAAQGHLPHGSLLCFGLVPSCSLQEETCSGCWKTSVNRS